MTEQEAVQLRNSVATLSATINAMSQVMARLESRLAELVSQQTDINDRLTDVESGQNDSMENTSRPPVLDIVGNGISVSRYGDTVSLTASGGGAATLELGSGTQNQALTRKTTGSGNTTNDIGWDWLRVHA